MHAHSTSIDQLLRDNPQLWRGNKRVHIHQGLDSGFSTLNALLSDGGWPFPGLVEVINPQPGNGELSLFLLAAKQLSDSAKTLTFIAPPQPIYAPSLVNAGIKLENCVVINHCTPRSYLWACEQALRSAACGMVFLWANHLSISVQRRLQLAASDGQSCGVIFLPRPLSNSRAAVQLRVSYGSPTSRLVTLLKARGIHKPQTLELPL